MTFEEYLTKRRVNAAAFAAAEPQRFAEWQNWFGQLHPESFYMLVKMVLNDVRRNYWLAEVPKPAAAAVSETTTSAPARPAGRRAAIARPAAVTSETTKPETPAEIPAKPIAEIPESKSRETEASTPPPETPAAKPGRPVFKPRAVIKKPTETSEEKSEAETGGTGEIPAATKASEEIKPDAEKTTTGNAESTPAKPARPRAVIKRPAALNKPTETEEKTVGNAAEKPAPENQETVGETAEKGSADNFETPKPPRPRPVFKRPAASAPTSENAPAEPEKTVAETPAKPTGTVPPEVSTDNPVARPGQEGASEAKAIAEEIHNNPAAAEAAEEVSAAVGHVPLTPRPRPVFKRPAPKPPENAAEAAANTVGETTQKPEAASAEEIRPEKPETKTTETTAEKPEGKTEENIPKPPRPRPIFKRPAKPENDNP